MSQLGIDFKKGGAYIKKNKKIIFREILKKRRYFSLQWF